MDDDARLKYYRISLVIFGLFCIFGIHAMMTIWPGGWTWEPRHPEYEHMIVGVYATMGFFMLLAAKNPVPYRSFVWFVVWSSVVHGGIMAFQTFSDTSDRANLFGDVPALFLMAGVLSFLIPKGGKATSWNAHEAQAGKSLR